MNKLFVSTLMGILAIGPVQASPLNTADIGADAKWVFHFDWEKYRTTETHLMIRETPARAKAEAKIAVATAMLGFNPLEDIDSITAYGNDYKQGTGAVIIKGLLDPQKATVLLEKNKTHKTEAYGTYTIHIWTANRGPRHSKDNACAFYNDSTVIISKTTTAVKAAIDVLNGKKTSLKAKQDGIVLPEVSADTIMLVYADNLNDISEQNPKAQIFKNADSLTIAAAETDGVIMIEAEMEAANAEKAVLLKNAIAGMLSFAMLGATENPAIPVMVNAIKVSTDGPIVKISFSKDPKELMDLMKQQMEMHEQRRRVIHDKQSPSAQ